MSVSKELAPHRMILGLGESISQETDDALEAFKNDFGDYISSTQHPEHFLSNDQPEGPMRRMDPDTLSPACKKCIEARFKYSFDEGYWRTTEGLFIICEARIFIFLSAFLSCYKDRSIALLWRMILERIEGVLYPDVVKILELWNKHDLDRWFPGFEAGDRMQVSQSTEDAGFGYLRGIRGDQDDQHDGEDQGDNDDEAENRNGDGGDHENDDSSEAKNDPVADFLRACEESRVYYASFSQNDGDDTDKPSTPPSPSAPNNDTAAENPTLSPPNDAAGPSSPIGHSSTLENEGIGADPSPSPRDHHEQPPLSDISSPFAPNNGTKVDSAPSRLSEGNEPGPLLHSSSKPYSSSEALDFTPPSFSTAMPRSTTTEPSPSHTEHITATEPAIDPTSSSNTMPGAPSSSPSSAAAKQLNAYHPNHTSLLSVGTSGENGPPVWFAWRKRSGGEKPCALFYDNQLNEKRKEELDLRWHKHFELEELDKSDRDAREKGKTRIVRCRQIIQAHQDDLKKKEEDAAAERKAKNAVAQAKRLATRQTKLEKKKRPREAEDSEKTLIGRSEESAKPVAKKQRREINLTVVRAPYETRQTSRATKGASTTPFVQGRKSPKPNGAKAIKSARAAGDTSATNISTRVAGNAAISNADGSSNEDPNQSLNNHNEMSSEPAATTQKQVTDNHAETPLITTATTTGNKASSTTAESHQSDPVNDIQHLVRKRPQLAEQGEDQSPHTMSEQQFTPTDETAKQPDHTSVSSTLSPFDQEKNPAWIACPSVEKPMSGYDHSSASSAHQSGAQVEESSSSNSSANTAALEQAQSSSTNPTISPESAHQPSFLPPVNGVYGMHTDTTPPSRKRTRSDEYHEQTEDSEGEILTPKAKKQKRTHDASALASPQPSVTTPMEEQNLPAPSNSASPPLFLPAWSSPSPPFPCFPRDDTHSPSPFQQAPDATVGMVPPPAQKRARSAEDTESQEDSEEGNLAPQPKRHKRNPQTSAPARSRPRANTPTSAQSRWALAHPIVPGGNLQSSPAPQQPFFPAVNTLQPSLPLQSPAVSAFHNIQTASPMYASFLQNPKNMKRPKQKPDCYDNGILVSSASEDSEEEHREEVPPPKAKNLTASQHKMDPRASGYVPRGTASQPKFGEAHDFMRTTPLNGRSAAGSGPSSFASASNGVETGAFPTNTFGTNGTTTATNSSNTGNFTPGFNAAVVPSTTATPLSAAKPTPTSTGSASATVEDTNAVGPTTAGSSDVTPTSSANATTGAVPAATSAVGPTITDSTVVAPPTTAGTSAVGPNTADSSSTDLSTPDVTLLSSQPVARHIKLEPLPFAQTLHTNLLITASSTPNIAPIIIQLFLCTDLESLFRAMVAECGYQGNEPVTKLSVTYAWSGRRQLLRRGKEADWRLFVETVRKGWAGVGEDAEGEERDVEILVHIE